jgi:hypothetical protein
MIKEKYVKAHLATPKQRLELQSIAELLKQGGESGVKLMDGDTEIPLQGCILKVFTEIVQNLESGLAVSVTCSDGMMGMAEAKEFLGISKKELLQLVDWQIIPCKKIDNNHRFLVTNLLDYLRSGRNKS